MSNRDAAWRARLQRLVNAAHHIQTGEQLQTARLRLGLSLADVCYALRMNGTHAQRHLREMESGTRDLGAIAAAVGLMLELEDEIP